MKKIILLLIIIVLTGTAANAQMRAPLSKADSLLTEEEAMLRINDFQDKVNSLRKELENESASVDKLKKDLAQAVKELDDCNKALLALVGATNDDIDKFRQALGVIEGKVRQMKKFSNDELADMRDKVEALENELNELRTNKISLLPEFFNKIQDLARQIKGLYREKSIKTYTVGTWSEDRDCLWNIAGKIEIYGDPFLWSKIWQTNKDIIRNPDIIHPGQVLTLPKKGPKDEEELRAERRYWKKKREEMDEMGEKPVPSKGE